MIDAVHSSPSSTVRFTKRLIGNGDLRRGDGLTLHFGIGGGQSGAARRMVGGRAMQVARSVSSAVKRETQWTKKRLPSCAMSVLVSRDP